MFNLDMKAAEIMRPEVFKVRPEATISEVLNLMLDKAVIGVAVVDNEERLLGMVTVDELLVKCASPEHFLPLISRRDILEVMEEFREEQKKAASLTAGEIMNRRFPTVDEEDSVAEAAGIFLNSRVSFLPVVRERKAVGIITKLDLLKALKE
ncbi:MAG: CBS domain-containing protein [bacterium]